LHYGEAGPQGASKNSPDRKEAFSASETAPQVGLHKNSDRIFISRFSSLFTSRQVRYSMSFNAPPLREASSETVFTAWRISFDALTLGRTPFTDTRMCLHVAFLSDSPQRYYLMPLISWPASGFGLSGDYPRYPAPVLWGGHDAAGRFRGYSRPKFESPPKFWQLCTRVVFLPNNLRICLS
jgi:hypothetical protein